MKVYGLAVMTVIAIALVGIALEGLPWMPSSQRLATSTVSNIGSQSFCKWASDEAAIILSNAELASAQGTATVQQRIINNELPVNEVQAAIVAASKPLSTALSDVEILFRSRCIPGQRIQIGSKYRGLIAELCDLSRATSADAGTMICVLSEA